jgi:hypothetical protein
VKIREDLHRANTIVEYAIDAAARDIEAAAKEAGATNTAETPTDASTSPT